MPEPTPAITITVSEELLPRYDASHGTPDPMVRRLAIIHTPMGETTLEQTDYGHPGRFNAWEPRGIPPALQPRTEELRVLCQSLSTFLR